MNLISHLFDSYGQWISAWDARTVSLFLHGALLVGTPTALCGVAFRIGNRTTAIQWLIAMVGGLFAAGIEVERWMPKNSAGLAWVVTLSLVLMVILPRVLAFFLVRRAGIQRILTLCFYVTLLGLLAVNLGWRGRP